MLLTKSILVNWCLENNIVPLSQEKDLLFFRIILSNIIAYLIDLKENCLLKFYLFDINLCFFEIIMLTYI